jgi:hypothetical protein
VNESISDVASKFPQSAEGEDKMEKRKRGIGGKRCVRRSISITAEVESKLKRLSISCDLPPATIAAIVLEHGLNSPSFINWLQDRYNKNEQYRCTPIIENTEEGKRVVLV